jgi:hypothetical protein
MSRITLTLTLAALTISVELFCIASTAKADQLKTVYKYKYPPPPQQGPPQTICYTFVYLDAVLNTLTVPPEEEPVLQFLVGGGQTPGSSPIPTLWMKPAAGRLGGLLSPNNDQGDLQLDNSLTEPIMAFAVAIPDPTVALPISGMADPVYTGRETNAWKSSLVRREQWDANVWSDLSVGSVGSLAEDVLPLPAPVDWAPMATGGAGRRFNDLFGDDPGLGAVVLYWTTSLVHAIAPGDSLIGFHLGATERSISSLDLPFVTFGAGTIHQASRISVVPEPSIIVLAAVALAGVAVIRGGACGHRSCGTRAGSVGCNGYV